MNVLAFGVCDYGDADRVFGIILDDHAYNTPRIIAFKINLLSKAGTRILRNGHMYPRLLTIHAINIQSNY